jgi:hypothetical protein
MHPWRWPYDRSAVCEHSCKSRPCRPQQLREVIIPWTKVTTSHNLNSTSLLCSHQINIPDNSAIMVDDISGAIRVVRTSSAHVQEMISLLSSIPPPRQPMYTCGQHCSTSIKCLHRLDHPRQAMLTLPFPQSPMVICDRPRRGSVAT